MKKSLLFLFAALLPLLASAQTKVEIDGIWYNIIKKANQAEVTFKGSSYNEYSNEYSGSITIPATVTYDGVECHVTSIGNLAFYGCSSLTAITIPEGVTSIGEEAFYRCSSLTSITLPESLTSIGNSAFYWCISLTAVYISDIAAWCKIKFSDSDSNPLSYAHNLYLNGELVTELSIPEGVTSIGSYAFSGCSSLTAITLPKNLKNIGSEAFANCEDLLDVYCYAEKVPSTEADAFDDSFPEYMTLHVPASALNAYKSTAPWSSFGTIVAIEDADPMEKCATPTISYVDGEVIFASDTEGATIISETNETTERIAGKYESAKFTLTPTYAITAYATKENYEDSDKVTATLCWIACNEEAEEPGEGIINIPSKAVLISTQGGTITVSGLTAGTEVAVYSTAGAQLATATATDDTATLSTDLTTGDIAIVKIGKHSIKVAIK